MLTRQGFDHVSSPGVAGAHPSSSRPFAGPREMTLGNGSVFPYTEASDTILNTSATPCRGKARLPRSRIRHLSMLDREKLIEAFDNFRKKLIRLGAVFIVLTAVGYWQAPLIAAILQRPSELPLVYYAPAEAFLTNLKLGVFAAVFIMTPVIFYVIWNSFAFYVTPYSRRYAIPVVLAASFLFLGVAYLCYALVLPFGLNFLVGFGGDVAEPQLSVDRYFSFVLVMCLAFGVFFELPLCMLMLGKAGLVNARMLKIGRAS